MFKPNPNYTTTIVEDLHTPSVQVELYPEHQLPTVYVQSDFGDCEVVVSDIYDLFSQERINNLGPDMVRDFIARNYPTSSAVSDAVSKMSDSEIINSIRSRHIQQPSELLAWSKSVVGYIDDILTPESPESPETPSLDTDNNEPSKTD